MRNQSFRFAAAMIVAACVLSFITEVRAETVGWNAFEIRDSNGATVGGSQPTFSERPSGAGIDATVAAGEKVGYGTSAFNGRNVADITSIDWDVLAAPNMNTSNEKSPYLNLWAGKGGNYAVFAPFSGATTDVSGMDWDALNVFIYEYVGSDFDWIESGAKRTGQQLFHSDDTPFTIAQLGALGLTFDASGQAQGGAGAPKNGDAFNLVFGDSAANYVGHYEIDNLAVTAVPVPAALPAGLALFGLVAAKRKFAKRKLA